MKYCGFEIKVGGWIGCSGEKIIGLELREIKTHIYCEELFIKILKGIHIERIFPK